MTEADQIVLNALKPYMSDHAHAIVTSAVEKAGGFRNLTDSVALAELVVAKKRFGSRSAAASYAANVRWQGKKDEMYAPDAEGRKYRTSTMNGIPTQFSVVSASASDAKEGDIVTFGSNRVPTKVESIKPVGDKLVITSRSLNNTDKFETTVRPNADIRKWTPESSASSHGALNPSRRVDSSRITGSEVRYINEGKNGPERVRRANEVIDRYASRGVDVSKPQSPKRTGGAQWLESGQ